MIALQKRGCHNINFVTPTHVIVQILEALPLAVEKGLTVPLVYNCGGYERPATLRLLEGIVDIYMPDFKFWDPDTAEKLCGARDYPRHARAALKEMHRQTGELMLDDRGIARRGVLVRHLVMPEGLADTEEVARFIAEELSPDTYVNIMSQYHPCGQALSMSLIARALSSREFQEALNAADRAGLRRLDERHKHWISIME
jgi:putative pyruvate formate lyase activating enzyme